MTFVLPWLSRPRRCGTSLDLAIQQAYQWSRLLQFDGLIAADVQEHLPDSPHQILQHLHTLLAPHGRLFAFVPSRLCRKDPGHFWTLLPAEWKRVVSESGFRIQRRRMSRLCWYGLLTPLPLAMVYELHAIAPVA